MEEPIAEIYKPELYFRGLILLISLFAIGMSLVLTISSDGRVYLPLVEVPLPESCLSRRFLGVDCPGCGMSRAFISITAGDWDAAGRFNSASFVMYLLVAIQIPWQGLQIIRTLKYGGPIETWWTLVPLISVVLWVLWCYLTRSM